MKKFLSALVLSTGALTAGISHADPVNQDVLDAFVRDPEVRARHRAVSDRIDGASVAYEQTLQSFSKIPQQNRVIFAYLVTGNVTSRDRRTVRSYNALVSVDNGRVTRVNVVELQ